MDEKMSQLKALVEARRFDEARHLVRTIDSPRQAEWLAAIDKLEGRASEAGGAGRASPERTTPPAVVSNKPLPLSHEAEQRLMPRGRPLPPDEIMRYTTPWRGSANLLAHATGWKAVALSGNYLKMGRPLYFVLSLGVYILLLAAAPFMLGLTFVSIQGGNLIFAVIFGVATVLLPAYPFALAWVQTEHYANWKAQHERTLAESSN